MTLSFACVLAACSSPSVQLARENGVVIAYLDGGLKVQSLDGKYKRASTAEEKRIYEAQSFQLPQSSPGGKFTLSPTDEYGRSVESVKTEGGHWVPIHLYKLKPNDLAFPAMRFVDWGPTDDSIVIERSDKPSDPFGRWIYSLKDESPLSFAGWFSPSRKLGITTPSIGGVYDVAASASALIRTDREGVVQNLYVVELPADLSAYDFRNATKVQLKQNEKPFHSALPASLQSVAGKSALRRAVEFSPTERWAIFDGRYLIDTKSGTVKQLDGASARFVTKDTPASKPDQGTITQPHPESNSEQSQCTLVKAIDTTLGASTKAIIAWSTQGQKLAVSSGSSDFVLFDTGDWSSRKLKARGPVQHLKFAATSKTLGVLCQTSRNELQLFDTPGRLAQSQEMQTLYVSDSQGNKLNSPIVDFAINSSGQLVVLGFESGKVERWATMVGAQVGEWDAGGQILRLEYSSDRDNFYVLRKDGTLQRWGTQKWDLQESRSLWTGTNVTTSMFLADESAVGTTSSSTAKLMSLGQDPIHEINLPAGSTVACFTPDGKRLLVCSKDSLTVYSTASGKPSGKYSAGSAILGAAVSEDSSEVALILASGFLQIVKT